MGEQENAESAATAKREPLTLYSCRLRHDQIVFLRDQPNSSEWLRKAIDDARIREPTTSTTNRVILLTQQIDDLKQKIAALTENPLFAEAKKEFDFIHSGNEQMKANVEFYEAGIRGDDPPGWKNNVERFFAGDHLERKLSDYKEWLARGLEAEAKPRAVIAGFEQEIQRLESERQRLEKELLQEGQAKSVG